MSREAQIKRQVQSAYTAVAARGGGCCGGSDDRLQGLGYATGELEGLPAGSRDVAAGCGNPLGLAEARPGETVLDLGSGGGIDVLLAAGRVGLTGRAIGVDMTPAMLERARQNAQQAGATNVEFRQGEIEALPVEDASVDLIISNCVINLSPDKDAVFREAHRVLAPGGRLVVSDLVTVGPLPEDVRRDAAAWAGCIAGALEREEYLAAIRRAGFSRVEVLRESGCAEQAPVVSVTVRAFKD